MRVIIIALTFACSATSIASALPSDPESIKARCAEYAKEDQVPAAELDVYLRDCVNALSDRTPEQDDVPAGSGPAD
jgi:hypothetical protein